MNEFGALERQDQRDGTAERIPRQIEGRRHPLADRVGQRVGSLVEAKTATGRRRVAEPGQIRSEERALGRDPLDHMPPDSAVGADAVQQHERLAAPDGVKGDHG